MGESDVALSRKKGANVIALHTLSVLDRVSNILTGNDILATDLPLSKLLPI